MSVPVRAMRILLKTPPCGCALCVGSARACGTQCHAGARAPCRGAIHAAQALLAGGMECLDLMGRNGTKLDNSDLLVVQRRCNQPS
jgi:hypothetical protein